MLGRAVLMCVVVLFTCLQMTGQKQYAFRISFTDKNGAPSLSNPLAFLSQRSLDRRTVQGIALDSTDRPVSPAYIDSILTNTTGKLHTVSRWLNQCTVLLTDSSKILTLAGKPFINDIRYIAVYANGLHKMTGGGKFEKELEQQSKTTGTASYYGAFPYQQTALVNGDWLHDHGYKGEGMLIAVFDEGFSNLDTGPAFDSMNNGGRLVDKYNFVKANPVLEMTNAHGTACISTIASYFPGTYVGAAPLASYAVYCTEIGASEQELEMDNILAASERCDSLGVDIISVSLGYNEFNLPTFHSLTYGDIDGKTTIAAKAANMATTKGMLFVASAGNEGGGPWNFILTPGDADSAITVGAAEPSKDIWANSGFGPNSSGRRKPDVCMAGAPAAITFNGSTVSQANATSYATPQLAGWAACLWQASGKKTTPYQLRDAIIRSADRYLSPDNHAGYGVPDFKIAFELLGIKDSPRIPTANNWVIVAPNPFKDDVDLNIYVDSDGEVNTRITDLSGRIVYSEAQQLSRGSQLWPLDLSHLQSGIYFLKVEAGEKQATVKLIKR
jgi:serine protease AprX